MKKLYLLFIVTFYCTLIQTAQESKSLQQAQRSQQFVFSFLPQDRPEKRRSSQSVQVSLLQNMEAKLIPHRHEKAAGVQKDNVKILEQELHNAMDNNNIERVVTCLAKEKYFSKRQQREDVPSASRSKSSLQLTLKDKLSKFAARKIQDELEQEQDSVWTGREYQLSKAKEENLKELFLVLDIDVINQEDERLLGKTLLHKAALNVLLSTMQLLVEGGADVNKSDNEGNTPIFDAVNKNIPKAILLLIDHGADIHHVNKAKASLLHRAGFNNADQSAQVLIAKGIDVNKSHQWGQTPLSFAKRWKADKVIPLLEAAGAQEKVSGDCSIS